MSDAEPKATKPKRTRPTSRPKRWADACAAALTALDALENALSTLTDLQSEYQEWRDNLPENLSDGALAEKLDAVCELSLEDAAQELRDTLDSADAVELPQGFGRD